MTAKIEALPIGPVAFGQRIQVLDAIRGFALFGILLVNVQWFNLYVLDPASIAERATTRLDGVIGWFVDTLVADKFWMLFSMLFGMGFALMLARAGPATGNFVARYLRRIALLALFGIADILLLWGGDILLDYAFGALLLLMILLCRSWIPAMLGAATLLLLAKFAGAPLGDALALVAFCMLAAIYLHSGARTIHFACMAVLLFASLMLMSIYGVSAAGEQQRCMALACLLLALALIAGFWQGETDARWLRAGATLLLLPVLVLPVKATLVRTMPEETWTRSTPAQVAAAQRLRSIRRLEASEEANVMRSGSYADTVRFAAKHHVQRRVRAPIAHLGTLGAFLIGVWLLRSGIVPITFARLRTLRMFAWAGFPFGLAFLLGSRWEANGAMPASSAPPTGLGDVVATTGNVLMALAYLSMLLLWFGKPVFGRVVSWLQPVGRMALTNYLVQSLVSALFFYGYGMGFYGLGRTAQAIFVLGIFMIQVLASRWWLSHYRFGPVEWLWRWATYARRPAFKVSA